MVKIIILISVVILCSYVGFGISCYYKNRSKFFKNLEFLFDKLKNEIKFSQNKLIEILNNYDSSSKEVKKLVFNFCNCLSNGNEINTKNLFNEIKILNDEEKNIIEIFLKTLGKYDTQNQTNQLIRQREEIHKLFEKSEEDAKKYGSLFSKLGIIIGLIIALIFI